MRPLFLTLMLFMLLLTRVSSADHLGCRAEMMFGGFSVYIDDTVENAQNATLFGFGDVVEDGKYPEIKGLYRVSRSKSLTTLIFMNSRRHDWSTIDPEKQC